MTTQIQPAKIGKGKAIHAGIINGCNAFTLCRVNHYCNETGATVPAEGEITCKKCLKELATRPELAARVDAEIQETMDFAHAEAIKEDEYRTAMFVQTPLAKNVRWDGWNHVVVRTLVGDLEEARTQAVAEDVERSHLAHWVADGSGMWAREDGHMLTCDLPVKRGTFGHEGPCFDRVMGVQRPALTLSRRQRKADRREQRAKLRRQAPQSRAAARTRRAQRGTARATAKTLLVAVGVPQDVAQRYAPAFSRGVEAPTVPTRVRTGEHRSKRVEVKRYDWPLFVETLERFVSSSRRQSFEVMPVFRAARERVLA
jgi:hypothetical protein